MHRIHRGNAAGLIALLLFASPALAQWAEPDFQPGDKVEVHGWVPFGEGTIVRKEGDRYLIDFKIRGPAWVPKEFISKMEAPPAKPVDDHPDFGPLYEAIG